jgi:RNA polymerase sigma-32 factor
MSLAYEEDGYRAYLGQLHRYEPLDRATEERLARRWVQQRDPEAANRLVCSNLRFVVKIANSYRNYGLRLADLVEEGNIGLLEALKRFDPERGHRFMTYAAYWVRACILAYVLKQRYMVGVGTGPMQSKLFFRLARERARLAATVDGGDLDERLAERFGTSTERVRAMAGRMEGRDISLDAEVFQSGHVTGIDLLVDERADVEGGCARRERDHLVRARVREAMRSLPLRERYIVEHRLLSDNARTLAEIGRHLKISRERVRQLEERVKGKLQAVLSDLVDHEAPPALDAAA